MISIAGQFHSGEEITNDGMESLWNLRNILDCSFGEGKVLEKPNMGGICLQRWPLRKLSTLFTLLHKWQQNILTFIVANYYQKSLSNISLTSLNIHLLLFKTHKPRFAIIVEETGSSLFLQLPPTDPSSSTPLHQPNTLKLSLFENHHWLDLTFLDLSPIPSQSTSLAGIDAIFGVSAAAVEWRIGFRIAIFLVGNTLFK